MEHPVKVITETSRNRNVILYILLIIFHHFLHYSIKSVLESQDNVYYNKIKTNCGGVNINKLEIAATKFRIGLSRAFPHNKKHLFCSVILCAAGSGTRMGGVSKQLIELLGKPCFIYSAQAFEKAPEVDEIVISARADQVEEIRALCDRYSLKKVSAVTAGGDTRQESVKRGFEKISNNSDIVMIHDAARPLITSSDVSLLYQKACRHGAVCASTPVTDTVKRADSRGVILETVPRDDLYLVQTPQVFLTDLYRVSLSLAERDGVMATDDCALAEHAGFPIQLVQLSFPNVKITRKEDLDLVLKLLKERADD